MLPAPFRNPADFLQDVRERLRDVLDEVLQARREPDAVGGRWYECHRGSPMMPVYVMVDAPGNAIHVEQTINPNDDVTITYFPAWLLSALLDAEGFDALKLMPTDFASAMPVRVRMRLKRDVADCGPPDVHRVDPVLA